MNKVNSKITALNKGIESKSLKMLQRLEKQEGKIKKVLTKKDSLSAQQLFGIKDRYTSSGGGKTGLGITLRVMAGDKIDIFGKSYYFQNNASDNTSNNLAATSILGALLSTSGGAVTSAHGAVTATQINPIAGTDVGSFLQNNRTPVTSLTPRAYINYIVLDDQYKYVTGGISPVNSSSSNTGVKDHHSDLSMQNINIPKNGYIYVYCSNESPVNVFFDNLQVVHEKGRLVEENHYYPFGLTMSGISSKAAGGVENKKKYNGIEFENDLDLSVYDANFRELDPQTGRWWQIDPKIENMEAWSPYASNYDNPITFSDPLGDEPEEDGGCCGGTGLSSATTGANVIGKGLADLAERAIVLTGGILNGAANWLFVLLGSPSKPCAMAKGPQHSSAP